MMAANDFNKSYLDILDNLALLSSSFVPDTNFSPSSDVTAILDSLAYQVRALRVSLVTVEDNLFKID